MFIHRLEIDIDNPELLVPLAGSDGEGSVAGTHHSPQYTSSVSETSEHRDDYVHVDLPYPSEVLEDIHPSDSASESQPRPHRRYTAGASRGHTGPRPPPRRPDRGSVGYRHREPAPESPESVDSAEDFVAGAAYRPDPRQRQSYYGTGHVVQMPPYAHSSSSGASYVYPTVPGPPSNQMVHYGAPPPAPYGQQYPQMGVPPSAGYPPAQPYQMSHHSGSHVSSPYVVPPYGGQQVMPFGPGAGYFPTQYPTHYPHSQPWDPYQRFPQSSPPPAAPAAAPEPAPPKSASPTQSAVSNTVSQEDIVKKLEAMLLEEKKDREAKEAAREAAIKAAADDLAAKAERAASDAKIAEEAAAKAREEVKKEAEAKAADDAAKAQAEAEAKAERAASDAKIAEEAAAKAKKEMEEAAAAAVPPPPEKKAPIRFKDAVGRKFNFPFHLCAKWPVSVSTNLPPPYRGPTTSGSFSDGLQGMEELIRQAFLHVEGIGPHVQEGHYDLLGPNGEIILPQVWETVVEPDWTVTMHMWPMPPEPEKPKTPPPLDGDIMVLGELLNPGKKTKGKGAKKLIPPPPPSFLPSIDALNITAPLDAPAASGKEVDKTSKKAGPVKTAPKKVVPSTGFSAWMMGGKAAKPPPKALKETKKPDGAAASQQGAPVNEGSCTVM
jgi:hypothetical protein